MTQRRKPMREALVNALSHVRPVDTQPVDAAVRDRVAQESAARYRSVASDTNRMRDKEMDRALQGSSRPFLIGA